MIQVLFALASEYDTACEDMPPKCVRATVC